MKAPTPIKPDYFKQKRFVGYLTAGLGDTLAHALALIEGGVDILEVGVPFSDPILDGIVIQTAMQKALANGTTPYDVLTICKLIKSHTQIPIVLFSYYNPLQHLGESYYQEVSQSGVDATLIVDLPLQEQALHLKLSQRYQLGNIQLLAPNSPLENIQRAAATHPAFLYYASRAGTTGVQHDLATDFTEKMQQIKHHTSIPVVAGFGVSHRAVAQQITQYADGFVVGSHFIKAILDGCEPSTLTEMARAIDPRDSLT